MPTKDANGNFVYSQSEYEHLNFIGERFSGFVEGIGYTCTDIVIETYAISKSKRTLINQINYAQYIYKLNDSLDQFNSNTVQTDSIGDSSNDTYSFTTEELRLALEKSQSYSFNQGDLPFVYRFISTTMSKYDNFFTNLGYNFVNDLFQVAQVASLGAFAREEWYNPFTGTRYGNLDGTPNYEPITGLHTAILMGMPMATKAKSLGYVIPKGLFHVEDFKWGKGNAGKYLNNLANMVLGFINGQISGGRGILKVKGFAPKIKEYKNKDEQKKENNE